MNNRELVEKAKEAKTNSYSPYSNFKVGAALEGRSGKIYLGTNVENVSFGMTVCAERNAVFRAITDGEREFVKIALVTDSEEIVTPCGACLQVLKEFSEDLDIIISWKNGEKVVKLNDLIPMAFYKDLRTV